MNKETFYTQADEARKKFKEDYDGKDIFNDYVVENYDDADMAKHVDYFLQYFIGGFVVGFDAWYSEDYFCMYWSDTLKHTVILDSDASIYNESWEEFLDSIWCYQQQAQDLEARISLK